jgi:hypothetical protein
MTLPGSLQGPCYGNLQPKSSGPSFFSKAATSSDHVMASRCYHLCALFPVRLYALAHVLVAILVGHTVCAVGRSLMVPPQRYRERLAAWCCLSPRFTHKGPLKEAVGMVTMASEIAAASCCVSSMVYLPWLFERSGRCVRNRYRDRLRILSSSSTIAAIGLRPEAMIPRRLSFMVSSSICCLFLDDRAMGLGTKAMVPLQSPSKKLLGICCLFHDQVHLAPENRDADNTSITTYGTSRLALLLLSWPSNGYLREQCRRHLERSAGMGSHILLSLQR